MKTIVIATRNEKKGGEMQTILRQFLNPELEIKTLTDYSHFDEPLETGNTYEENAIIKAQASSTAINQVCIADDAGLEIDALNGEPGIYSKRFGGANLGFSEKIKMILGLLQEVPKEKRTARFRCWVAIAKSGMRTKTFEAVKEGLISELPMGNSGFGYDPIFFLPESGKTYAQMESNEKNQISHRAIVLKKAAEWLNNFNEP